MTEVRGWAAALAVAMCAAAYALFVAADGMVDLRVYRMGGEAVLSGGLYDARLSPERLAFTYPPVAALLFLPAGWVPLAVAAAAWTCVSVLALAHAVRLLVERLWPLAGWWVPTAVVAASLTLEPVWSHLLFGQVNTVLMALVVHDLLRPRRPASGVLIGIAAGLKLTPLVFVVLLLLVGRVRAAAVAAATFAATVGLGFLLAPQDAWAYWTGLAFDARRVGGVAYAGNQSALAALWRTSGGEPSRLAWLVAAALLGGSALLLARAAWRGPEPESRPWAVCLAALGMLLASPISWNHHWVWVVPVVLVLWRLGGRVPRGVAAAWVVVTAGALIRWPPRAGDREVGWSALEQLAGNAYLLLALATLGVAARWRPAPGPPSERDDPREAEGRSEVSARTAGA